MINPSRTGFLFLVEIVNAQPNPASRVARQTKCFERYLDVVEFIDSHNATETNTVAMYLGCVDTYTGEYI